MALALQHRVGNARRSFFERGTTPVGTVPDNILQSWRRCQRSGLLGGDTTHRVGLSSKLALQLHGRRNHGDLV